MKVQLNTNPEIRGLRRQYRHGSTQPPSGNRLIRLGWYPNCRMTATRSQFVSAVSQRLKCEGLPRLQMLIVVIITGLSGLFASIALLHWHLRAMWIRYGLCVGLAYVVFLLLLRLWIYWRARRASDVTDVLDLADARTDTPDGTGNPSRAGPRGDGGFDFDLPLDLDFDEGLVVIAFVAAFSAALIACWYVIFSAPSLFAEILIDGVCSAGLYRRIQTLESRHWLESAVRRTAVPFVLVALSFMVAGGVSQRYAPAAASLGGVLKHYHAIHAAPR